MQFPWKGPVGAFVTPAAGLLPSVSVLPVGGHGPAGPLAVHTQAGLGPAFVHLHGLVIGSSFHAICGAAPLQHAFRSMGRCPLGPGSTLRASPVDAPPRWQRCRRLRTGLLTAAILSFAHGGRVWRGADDWRQHPGQDTGGLYPDLRPCGGHGNTPRRTGWRAAWCYSRSWCCCAWRCSRTGGSRVLP